MKRLLIIIFLFSVQELFAQNLNQSLLDSIIRQSERTNSNALLIYKGSELVYKNYFGKPIQPIEAMSASKSIVSIAIGMLVDKGLIKSIDDPVHTFYPEWKQGNKKNITIRHLLNHTSGLQNVPNAGVEIEVAPDVVQLALAAELDDMPGKRFSYNNKASNLLPGIVEKASGVAMDRFLKEHLFSHLGIKQFTWVKDKAGNPLGMSGFHVLPEDFAKIGLLILNKGTWHGKQLLSKEWIDQMLSPSERNTNYGFEWWLLFEKQAIVIDEDFFAPFRESVDTSTFRLLQKLKGSYEGGMNELRSRARRIYSGDELADVGKILSSIPQSNWKIQNIGSVVGYVASGYLGQNLILIPEKQLVVVRMITAENFKKVVNNSEFAQLKSLVSEL